MGLLSIIRGFYPIRERWKTTGGLRLCKHPSLDEPPRVKYAVFSDRRVFDRKKFDKVWKLFESFLAEEFYFRGGPLNENAFEFCLGMQRKGEEFSSSDFKNALVAREYNRESGGPQLGDIIAYYFQGGLNIYTHAGIYFGNEVVRSRWGENGPIVEHPILEVLPLYIEYLGALDISEFIDRDKIRFDVWRRRAEEPQAAAEISEATPHAVQCYGIEDETVVREDCNYDCENCEVNKVYKGRVKLS
ncbi:MAG: hypothetical protein Q8N99_04390 [Nanoarchaeota archaeon]|nr:hypothetical protein [Nanoarchaeota archaeon]